VAIDVGLLYPILASVAAAQDLIEYSALSRRYERVTGENHDPHGSRDYPLGELNRRLHAAGLPALSAVVVLRGTQEPGGGFWGSSPGVPARPKSDEDRIAAFADILQRVHRATWPESLP